MGCPDAIMRLIERFDHQLDQVRSPSYNEAQLRIDFINPMFRELGWDIDNVKGSAEQYREVVYEDRVRVAGANKAPDYSFRIGGSRKFFLEAKKPFINLRDAWEPAYQLRRYAWSAKLAASLLTDFEELAVYDCRVQPKQFDKPSTARREYMTYRQYEEKWDFLAGTFSNDAVRLGDFDRYCGTARGRGAQEFDDAFLVEIEGWRTDLAKNIAIRNAIGEHQINFAVQRIIDRIIFLRICEDRGIEHVGQLRGLLNGEQIYARLFKLFRDADTRYNSGLFHFKPEPGRDEQPDELTPGLEVDDATLKSIIKRLYYPESPYEFTVVSADILGSIYERFLGKVITLTGGHRARIEEKPEVRKAGGVYYTPTYIVDYIVQHTVGKLLGDEGVGAGGWGLKKEAGGAAEELPGTGGVEGVHGVSGGGVPADGAASGGGEVRAEQPVAPGGGVDPDQHRGGLRPQPPGRLSAPPVLRPGIADGNRDVADDQCAPEAGHASAAPPRLGSLTTSRPNADEANLSAATRNPQTLTPQPPTRAPKPLTPKEAAKLKILDPACGSGSFLIGAYQYLLDWHLNWYAEHEPEKWAKGKDAKLRPARPGEPPPSLFPPAPPTKLSESWRLTIQERKRILLNNIHGVDIDYQAVEVTKLSLLLKVLEGETAESLGLFRERALPDLGRNIQCGNSLIGTDIMTTDAWQQMPEEERRRINPFDFERHFPRVFKQGGFDVVIGNPPYGAFASMRDAGPPAAEYFKEAFATAGSGNYDIYVLFVERALRLLNSKGSAGYILPSKFFATDYGSALRALLTERSAVRAIADFGHQQVFRGATTYTCLLFLTTVRQDSIVYLAPVPPESLREGTQAGRAIPGARLTAAAWSLGTDAANAVRQKATTGATPLLQLPCDIARGSSTGDDDVFMLAPATDGFASRDGKRVHVEESILRLPLYASSISRYLFRPAADERVIFPYHVSDDGYEPLSEDELRSEYPLAHRYLMSRRRRLELRKQYSEWYAYSAPRSLNVHDGAHFAVPLLANTGLYAPLPADRSKYCLMASGGFSISLGPAATIAPNYVLGLLNSRLLFWLLKGMSHVFRGGWITCTKQYVGKLPVRMPADPESTRRHDKIAELVGSILKLHQSELSAKLPQEKEQLRRQIEATDRQIDQLVYELYGLNEAEIRIVEEAKSAANR